MKTLLALSMVSGVAMADPNTDKARQQAVDEARKAGILTAKATKEHGELLALLGPVLSCEGTLHVGSRKVAFTGTMHEELVLDGAWIHEWFEGSAGKEKIVFDAHLAFDTTTKQWTRIMVSNRGSYELSHAPALANGKLDWDNDAMLPGGNAMKTKTHLDASDGKVAKVVGETSTDGGKTFGKAIEMTCAKHQ